jgi:hypothetical protein
MSAFICGDKHIASLASWYGAEKGLPSELVQMIANELKKINIKSVNYRYNDKVRFSKCSLKKAILLLPEEALVMAHCLDYQSCELRDYTNPILADIEILAVTRSNPNIKSDIWELL